MSHPIWNQRIFYELLCLHSRGRRWLDLGCGRGPDGAELTRVRSRAQENLYVGVDLDMGSLKDSTEVNRILSDVKSLPFPDGSFDLVTSNMVFEHLGDPVAVLMEANRVLAEEGILLIHTACSVHYMLLVGRILSSILPNGVYRHLVSRYTGRRKEDIFPTRYRANTGKAFSRAAFQAGFKGGVIAYLETPMDSPTGVRFIEERLRTLLPSNAKSTMLALYLKRDWT